MRGIPHLAPLTSHLSPLSTPHTHTHLTPLPLPRCLPQVLRSAMRAVRALEKMADADSVAKFADLLRNTLRGGKVKKEQHGRRIHSPSLAHHSLSSPTACL